MSRTAILVIALAASGCSDQTLGPIAEGPLPVSRLRAEPLSYSYHSASVEPQRLVVRDQATLTAIWSALWQTLSHPPAMPVVDFDREMLIVATLGQRPTGGFSVFIDAAVESASLVALDIRSVSPGPHCAVTLALTTPVDIARLPRRDKPVTFNERSEVQSCP